MIDLVERSYKQEILDGNDIPFADIRQNMRELNAINTHLGGHAITIAGVKNVLGKRTANGPITICEIGCGGGDNLQAISEWCSKKNIPATFIGIDIKQECIDYAQQQYPLLNCQWLLSDYKELSFLADEQPVIIFSSLFCHHFNEQQLVIMLKWMEQNASKGFFINDLHRHWLAYYSIRFITRFFSHSYLVKNDAPLSVARGFIQSDWQKIIAAAEIKNYSITWKWAFRHLIVHTNE